MTIKNRVLNARLSNLQVCAQQAPAGTYQDAKDAVEAINDILDCVQSSLGSVRLKAPGDDSIRNLEVAIYEYILTNNPDRFQTAEGFGEHVDGPAGSRIVAQAIRDRDALKALGVIR